MLPRATENIVAGRAVTRVGGGGQILT